MYDRTITRLAALARVLIQRGELPCTNNPLVWAGHGIGKPCSLCRGVIPPQEVVYEVEVKPEGAIAPQALRFHIHCHTAWIVVCSEKPLASKG
jgi:hypothetical protein